ncbi:hypothetical protein HY285_04650 [Candidatus Peregrinibacteria bacterium]|nr:hypothetical protein [Candidatus Peregrinibacteria bacterium]MBI3816802.1 hypothetical protein [Candidatus Peregrinibacteria bacterium]
MCFLLRFQWHLFVALCSVIGFFLLIRIGFLLPLYTSSSVRANVRSSLERLSHEHGWLLSDIDLRQVSSTQIRFLYRPHLRGCDPSLCYVLMLSSHILQPCASGS